MIFKNSEYNYITILEDFLINKELDIINGTFTGDYNFLNVCVFVVEVCLCVFVYMLVYVFVCVSVCYRCVWVLLSFFYVTSFQRSSLNSHKFFSVGEKITSSCYGKSFLKYFNKWVLTDSQ